MNKIIISIIVGIGMLAGLLLLLNSREYAAQRSNAKPIRIAFFTPATHAALEEIEQGFKETLHELSPSVEYQVTTFNANGNKTLLSAQAQEIVGADYDLIASIGASCSQTLAQLLHKKGSKTPHVFTGVDGPVFAESLAKLNPTSTGVYVRADYERAMEMLHAVKPAAKNILLVYDPTHGTGLEKHKQALAQYVKKLGMELHAVEIYQANEIQQKVAALVPTMDVVFVFTDNTVVAGIDALITLCNRFGVTLFASDLSSGAKGAALSYGITEYDSGSGAARVAYMILVEGQQPCALPPSAIQPFRLMLNKETMQAQNVQMNEALQQFISNQEGN